MTLAPPAPAAVQRLTLTTHDRLDSLTPDEWRLLFPSHPDSFELSRLTTTSGLPNFTFASLVVRQGPTPLLFLPLFQTDFALANLVDGKLATLVGVVSKILPRIFSPRLLGVGFVEGEWGAAGIHPDASPETLHQAWSLALPALEQLRRQRRADITLFLNALSPGPGDLPPGLAPRFSTIDAYPCAQVPLPFATTDDYLDSLSKSARKDLRRKLKSAGPIKVVRTTDPRPHLAAIHALYTHTVASADLSFGTHTPDFFARVCDEVPGAHFVLYFLGDALLAFNLLIHHNDTLVDKYFSMSPTLGREHNLYFLSWMENVQYCTQNKIPTYHAGPGAEATKSRLGATFLPCVTRFRHRNPLTHRLLHALRPLLSYHTEVDTHPATATAPQPLTPICLNTDGSITTTQPDLTPLLAATLDLTPRIRSLRLSAKKSTAATLRNDLVKLRQQHPAPWLTLLGSGDFHYLSLLLLETLPPTPFHLILIDNHPDWFAEPPKYHCGNWLSSALKLPHLRTATLIGQASDDFRPTRTFTAPHKALRTGRLTLRPLTLDHLSFPLRRPRTLTFPSLQSTGTPNAFRETAHTLANQNVYVSIDKDVLRPADAVTDWEQGNLSLDDLTAGLRTLAASCNIIGADITGEHAPTPLAGWFKRLDAGRPKRPSPPPAGWQQLNERANLAILSALGVPK